MNLTPASPLAANPASPALSPGTQVLAACRAEGRAALIGYLPVGFPSVEVSIEAMVAMVLMDQALRHRAQCGDVGTITPRIPGQIDG